jgi:hypothetical protein
MPDFTVSTVLGQIVTKGFEVIFSELAKKLFSKSDVSSSEGIKSSHFKEHCSRTFDRCTKIKTLLSRDEPVDMLQQYVNIKLRVRRKASDVLIDDYDAINEILDKRRVTIVGTAGSGKTVFMRYLWISLFAGTQTKIPLFLELRRLNTLTTLDIVNFIFRSIITTDSKVDPQSFNDLVNSGKFVFVFDGFDEVSIDKRETVQAQILELCARNKANVIIVSGRPDDRFDAWQEFSKYKVEPLNLQQIVTLVERVSFDSVIKKKFIESLKKDLYEKHSSFLSSPLLATMMLLTFENYADIPEKIHVFFDVAFTTLFSRHDALKEAFRREKYTKFPIDVFRTQLSCLCILTYQDEKFSFTESELLTYIAKSAILSNTIFVAEHFMKDLLESVCIMQEDGIEIAFVHRSFQEYFAAVYLENMPRDRLQSLLPRLTKRRTDSVFAMFNDMNHELLEEAYVMPMIKKARRMRRGIGPSARAIDIANSYKVHVVLVKTPVGGNFYVYGDDKNDVWRFRDLTVRLYRDIYANIIENHEFYLVEDRQVSRKITKEIFKGSLREHIILSQESQVNTSIEIIPEQMDLIRSLFEQSGTAHLLISHEACFGRLLDEIPRNNRKDRNEYNKCCAYASQRDGCRHI